MKSPALRLKSKGKPRLKSGGDVVSIDLELLADLLVRQDEHDRGFHSDVFTLPLQDRIRHLTFHFAKYVGRVVQSTSPQSPVFRKTLADILIIGLSACNALQLRDDKNLSHLLAAHGSLGEQSSSDIGHFVLVNLALATAVMAKACEARDHSENLNYDDMLKNAVTQIVLMVLKATAALHIDPLEMTRQRWAEIEVSAVP